MHEPYWTATARHADIVVPSATALERADFAASRNDPVVVAMHQATNPPGEAKTDYEVFSELAARLGVEREFTEGRTAHDWLVHLYEKWRAGMPEAGLPAFDEFWAHGSVETITNPAPAVMLRDFVRDPVQHPLGTPSGLIELSSSTIGSFGYDDCPGHPTWFPPMALPTEEYPLVLVTTQPSRRLHSQLDMGPLSQEGKVDSREPIVMHPVDAQSRGIDDGDVVMVTSARGRCLAGVKLTQDIRAGCVQMATGAWFDPWDAGVLDSPCVHGNVNVLTTDRGTSRLAQGCAGQLTSVDVRVWVGAVPPVAAYLPPDDALPPRPPSPAVPSNQEVS